WQAPALQPPTFRAAMTWWRKLTGPGLSTSLTVSLTLADCPPTFTTRLVAPFFLGSTKPPASTPATPGVSQVISAKGVTSRTEPSAYLAVMTTCCMARGPVNITSAGWITSDTGLPTILALASASVGKAAEAGTARPRTRASDKKRRFRANQREG